VRLDLEGRRFFSARSFRLSTYPKIGCAVFYGPRRTETIAARHPNQRVLSQHTRDFLTCLVFRIDDPPEELWQHHTPYLSFVLPPLGASRLASMIQKFGSITIFYFIFLGKDEVGGGWSTEQPHICLGLSCFGGRSWSEKESSLVPQTTAALDKVGWKHIPLLPSHVTCFTCGQAWNTPSPFPLLCHFSASCL